MSPPEPLAYAARIEADLLGNILPYWRDRVVDGEGGFFGSIANDGKVDAAAERGALLTSRILWTFSAAYARYRDPAYRKVADHAYADLVGRFRDPQYGGFRWSVSPKGGPSSDRKQVYGQAFAIYALSEYHAATGAQEPLDHAVATFNLIEEHARDRVNGGYFEAYSRAWTPVADMRLSTVDLNEPKSQNTHLHVMEAYARLLSVRPGAPVRDALADIVDVMLRRIVDPATGHLGLFFSETWAPRSDRVSYGHDIEAAWLLCQAGEALGDAALEARLRPLAVRIAEVTLAEGVDADGGVLNEGGPSGLTNTDKEWWPQAEAVVGFLNACEVSGNRRFLAAACRTWDFIEARLVDKEGGEWFRGVTRDGKLLAGQMKVSFWKCPYHNGRTGLEAVRRLRSIAGAAEGHALSQ
jgi:mannobiose 2-epimerase